MSPRDVVMTTRTASGELLTITPGIAGGDGSEYWEMREHLQNNGGSVDWDYWLNLSQWTPTEAACLSDAVDPSFWQRPPDMKRYDNQAHAHTRPASDEIEKIERWCKDKNESPLSPDEWVRILRERGHSLPPALAGLGADEPAHDEPRKAEPRQTEINRWLRNTWEAEKCPGGTEFFRKLKGYRRKPGSPILEWYQAGKDAGIEYEINSGTRKPMSKKALQNKVSEWKQAAAASDCP